MTSPPARGFVQIPSLTVKGVEFEFKVDPTSGLVRVNCIGMEIRPGVFSSDLHYALCAHLHTYAEHQDYTNEWLAYKLSARRCYICKTRMRVEKDTLGLYVCFKHGQNCDAAEESSEREED